MLAAETDLREAEADNKRKQPDLFGIALLKFTRFSSYNRQGEPVFLLGMRDVAVLKTKHPVTNTYLTDLGLLSSALL